MIWQVAGDLTEEEQTAFRSETTTFALTGDLINDSKTNYTQRVVLSGRRYYVKRYLIPGKHFRRYLGRSRVVREWANLKWFIDNEIPTARLIAMGEGGRFFGHYWGVIVTEEVAQTLDLRRVYRNQEDVLKERAWRCAMIDSLADVVAKMHDKRFIHNDLNWRNLLVTIDALPQVYVIDCPAGRPVYLKGNRRGLVRDLAFLDKMAKDALSRTDRLRFYLRYRNIDRLRGRDKKEISRILGFLT